MTRKEFITRLQQTLQANHITAVHEIVSDYEEHFNHALAEGKTEQEVCEKLGSPETIAHAYETEKMITTIKDPARPFNVQNALTILGRLVIITPLNFLILFIPGAMLFAILTAGWSVCLSFLAVGFSALAVAFQSNLFNLSGWFTTAVLSGSLGFMGLAVCVGFLMFFLTKSILLLAINYLQWNLKFILEK